MNHSFNTEIAQKYGINEAILIENFAHWILKNRANNKHFYDGHTWTYNSIKAFAELFPYMSEKQIRSALERLHEKGLIFKGNYNPDKYKQTLWYALSDELLKYYEPQEVASDKKDDSIYTKGTNGATPIVEMYKDSDINTDINNNNVVVAHAAKPFRKLSQVEFREQVRSFAPRYSEKILKEFYDHWREKNDRQIMRFQLQTVWETGLRLEVWAQKEIEIMNRDKSKKNDTAKNIRPVTGRNTGADQLLAKTLAIASTLGKADDGS